MDRFVDVETVFPRRRLLGKRSNPGDDFAGSISVCSDQHGRLTGFLQLRSGKPAQAGICVIDHRAERLINLMTDRRRHLTQSRHPRHMRQLRSRFKQGLLCLLALGHIPAGPHVFNEIAACVDNGMAYCVKELDRAVRKKDPEVRLEVTPFTDCSVHPVDEPAGETLLLTVHPPPDRSPTSGDVLRMSAWALR